jgi:predicted alpha/beta hydrolase
MRRENTDMALDALADGVTYRATQYNNATQTTEVVTVQAGTACSQLLRRFAQMLPREPPTA